MPLFRAHSQNVDGEFVLQETVAETKERNVNATLANQRFNLAYLPCASETHCRVVPLLMSMANNLPAYRDMGVAGSALTDAGDTKEGRRSGQTLVHSSTHLTALI